jgi:hypothetical protein
MKHIAIALSLALLLTLSAAAESPQQWAGVSLNFNQYAAPQVNGTAAYARRLTDNGHPTYSFSAINFLSVQKSPFRVATTTETGIAQYVTKFGAFSIFGLGTAGLSTVGSADGTATGGSFSGGGMAQAGIGHGVTIGVMFRAVKPSISETQYPVGLVIGWGK